MTDLEVEFVLTAFGKYTQVTSTAICKMTSRQGCAHEQTTMVDKKQMIWTSYLEDVFKTLSQRRESHQYCNILDLVESGAKQSRTVPSA